MIITKTGRKMFPVINVRLSNLDPQAYYCVFLDMHMETSRRFKYSSTKGGWAPGDNVEAQNAWKLYLHTDSPALGEKWMAQIVSFSRLKLTNTAAPPSGQVVLSSMHKYQPRIIVVKSADPSVLTTRMARFKCAVFSETQFIAVTAYQNEKITQLKIDNNPFAKGFRENGKSGAKRKKANSETEEEELIDVLSDISEVSDGSSKKSKIECDVICNNCPQKQLQPIVPRYQFSNPPYYFPVYPHTYWSTMYNLNLPLRSTENVVYDTKPSRKRFSDFFIDTILKSR